jgi:lysophospholipase L1-like esterase
MIRYMLYLLLFIIISYSFLSGVRFYYLVKRATKMMQLYTAEDYVIPGGPNRISVAVVGDSTAVGVGSSHLNGTYHYQYLKSLSDKYTFDVINVGVSGAKLADVQLQLNKIKKVDLMLLTIGGNNATRFSSKDALEQGYRNVMSQAVVKARKLILITPGDLRDVTIAPLPIRFAWGHMSARLSSSATRVVSEFDVIHVDIYKLHSSLFREKPDIYYASDGFHPSDAGYKLWADALPAELVL